MIMHVLDREASTLEIAKPDVGQQSRNSKSFSSSRSWYLLWLLMAVTLVAQVGQSWWFCISRRAASDNYLIVLAGLVMLFSLRRFWTTQPREAIGQRDLRGLLVLGGASIVCSAGTYFHFSRLYWVGFLIMIAGSVWALAGGRMCKHWLPVFIFSLELIPGSPVEFANSLTSWLKVMSMKVALSIASLFIPIEAHGNFFSVKGYAFEVSNACCGLAMLSGLVFVVLLWQLFRAMPVRKIFLLVALATLLAALLNGVRLCLTALIAYGSSQQVALSVHSNLEIVLFPAAMAILWYVSKRVLPG